MTKFSDLSNELIICIWEYVLEPEAVESFALVSKRTYMLSGPFLREHARLKSQYANMVVDEKEKDMRPAKLLEKLLQYPRIAFYVRDFSILRWATSRAEQRHEWTSLSEGTMAVLESAIRCSSFVTPSEAEDWIKDVKGGNEEPALALILVQLTKLRTLWISSRYCGSGRYLARVFEHIAGLSDTTTSPEHSVAETDLKRSSQPSFPDSQMFFKLKKISIEVCSIKLDAFLQPLRSIRELEYFCCMNTCSRDHYSERIVDPASEMGLVFGKQDWPLRRLADVLPASIERLSFTSWILSLDTAKEAILGIARSKMGCLPNVRQLSVMTPPGRDDEWVEAFAELEKECAKVGIEFHEIYF